VVAVALLQNTKNASVTVAQKEIAEKRAVLAKARAVAK